VSDEEVASLAGKGRIRKLLLWTGRLANGVSVLCMQLVFISLPAGASATAFFPFSFSCSAPRKNPGFLPFLLSDKHLLQDQTWDLVLTAGRGEHQASFNSFLQIFFYKKHLSFSLIVVGSGPHIFPS
jgi:hypothetical protein